MSIHIIKEPPVYLTQEQHDRLRQEYETAHMFYSGPVPSFEVWVRGQMEQPVYKSGTAIKEPQ